MRFVCPDGESQYRRVLDGDEVAALLAEGHQLEWHDGAPGDSSTWAERLRESDGVLLLWSLPSGALSASPTVRIVSFAGSGVASYVDMSEARRCGVLVCNVPSYGANATAEHAFALILAAARQIPAGDQLVRTGGWGQEAEGLELRGRRLGVVGAGPIGARVVELGKAFGMDVVVWTRTPSAARQRELGVPFVTLSELFRSSDAVTLHLAHAPETERMIDGSLLELLGPDALFINTARGALVDGEALARLLAAGAFRSACLDVFESEPPPGDHPLLQSERVVLSPHVGFRTREATEELFRVSVDNLLAFARGSPTNVCQ